MSTVSHLHIHKWVLLVKYINNIFVSHLHIHKWVLLAKHINNIFVIGRGYYCYCACFIILLNSMVHLTDLDYTFVYVFWCNG